MHGIVLFDGHCNFCSSSVQFIMKRDKDAYFQFASLQSEVGQQLLQQYHISSSIDSVVVISDNKAYVESAAALQIARHLDGAWRMLAILSLIPAFIRDPLYRLFAKNRYRLFGQQEACMLPTQEQRQRFL